MHNTLRYSNKNFTENNKIPAKINNYIKRTLLNYCYNKYSRYTSNLDNHITHESSNIISRINCLDIKSLYWMLFS